MPRFECCRTTWHQASERSATLMLCSMSRLDPLSTTTTFVSCCLRALNNTSSFARSGSYVTKTPTTTAPPSEICRALLADLQRKIVISTRHEPVGVEGKRLLIRPANSRFDSSSPTGFLGSCLHGLSGTRTGRANAAVSGFWGIRGKWSKTPRSMPALFLGTDEIQ